MRVRVLSDLHRESEDFDLPPLDTDLVILAGDIDRGCRGIEWAAGFERTVIYVAGNHEYYGHAIPHLTEKMRLRARALGVHFLERNSWYGDGIRILGCTLWTDFKLFGDRKRSMLEAEALMNDNCRIRRSPTFRRFRARDSRHLHLATARWLTEELSREFRGSTIVVTHHAPSIRSVPKAQRGDPLLPAYASEVLTSLPLPDVDLWIHGHTHHQVDYRIGTTRVVSNPRGYPDEDSAFDPSLVLEV